MADITPTINGVLVEGDKTLEDYGIIQMTIEDFNEIVLEIFGNVF